MRRIFYGLSAVFLGIVYGFMIGFIAHRLNCNYYIAAGCLASIFTVLVVLLTFGLCCAAADQDRR